MWKTTSLGVRAPSGRKGSNPTDATKAIELSNRTEGGSPSPRPSPPGEGEALAAFVETDAPGCSRAFWAEGQEHDRCNRGYRAFKQRPEVLPLPGGEGRGEGEPPSDQKPKQPQTATRPPAPQLPSGKMAPAGKSPSAQSRGAQSRQAKTKPLRSNPNGVAPQSPGLARRQPWVIARRCSSTPTGLRPGGRKTSRLRCLPATTPLGLRAPPSPLPRVVPSVQPWALFHNRVAVEGAQQLSSRPLSLTRKLGAGLSSGRSSRRSGSDA